ncbi:uncharacterized protein DNG_01566 [Cephalotrichum gorgonifer]|uniref:Dolichyl-diphosphooligosaccharide--protein glycosyltransferase subunit 4 n=1 Tax=Cephalotrichum gorgonifer TaxID=2041049 RepID=A0AAE8MTF4_9PEZI|nr:uncharacterized protein DNG_01566 [Cephalotrichum gorgonifer]
MSIKLLPGGNHCQMWRLLGGLTDCITTIPQQAVHLKLQRETKYLTRRPRTSTKPQPDHTHRSHWIIPRHTCLTIKEQVPTPSARSHLFHHLRPEPGESHDTLLHINTGTMISDSDLYSIAIFLGCASALLIVVYHFIEVNGPKTLSGKAAALQGQSIKSQRASQ